MRAFYKTRILAAFISLAPVSAFAQCDEFVGNILAAQLRPIVENVDCSVLKKAGLDNKRHKLGEVCYESSGPTSHIRIGAHLRCEGSGESVAAKLRGRPPSASENVTLEFDVNGQDCRVSDPKVKPSGELGKALANIFKANERAKQALEQGLAQVCKK